MCLFSPFVHTFIYISLYHFQQSDSATPATDDAQYNKCIFCNQTLDKKDEPKLLECLHVSCANCIASKLDENETGDRNQSIVKCAVCGTSSRTEKVILNQFLMEQSDAAADDTAKADDPDTKAIIKCSSCSEDETATSWCVECAEYICDSCVRAHQRLKITKDHTIKTKEEALTDNQSMTTEEKSLMCATHSQEKLSLFCETCDKLTCRDCQLVDHRDHKYKFANEIATEARTTLSQLLNEITYKRVLLTSAMNVIDERQRLFSDKKKELVKDITNMVMKITNTVNARGKQLVLRLNEVTDSKLKVLNEKKDALQQLSKHTDHCIGFVKAVVDKGSDSAVLFSKKTLTNHLQKVKSQRADIPNPEIPVRIQVQLNQVGELQKVISQLGTILVDGKVYPPIVSPGQCRSPRQQPSPNQLPHNSLLNPNAMSQQTTNLPAVPTAAGPTALPQMTSMPRNQMRNTMPPCRSPQMNQMTNPNCYMPNMYNRTPPLQQSTPPQVPQSTQPPQPTQPFVGMTRSYSTDSSLPANANNAPVYGRFTNMGPRPHFRQNAPHVSSSTHPQNIGKFSYFD